MVRCLRHGILNMDAYRVSEDMAISNWMYTDGVS